jgi:hypothetical protein
LASFFTNCLSSARYSKAKTRARLDSPIFQNSHLYSTPLQSLLCSLCCRRMLLESASPSAAASASSRSFSFPDALSSSAVAAHSARAAFLNPVVVAAAWAAAIAGALTAAIRALSAHSAAEFNILPGRWQHAWLVAIVPPERWGKMDRNDCHTAWGNFKTLHSLLHHYKNNAWFFSFIGFFSFLMVSFFLCDLVSPSDGCKSQLF